MFNEKWTFLNVLVFHLPKKEPEPTQNIGSGSRANFKLAPALAKNLSSDRLRLHNTASDSKQDLKLMLICM